MGTGGVGTAGVGTGGAGVGEAVRSTQADQYFFNRSGRNHNGTYITTHAASTLAVSG